MMFFRYLLPYLLITPWCSLGPIASGSRFGNVLPPPHPQGGELRGLGSYRGYLVSGWLFCNRMFCNHMLAFN